MATISKIEGVQSLIDKLKHRAASEQYQGGSVAVGYTARYALYIHENREIWPPGMRLASQSRGRSKGHYWDPQGSARPGFLLDVMRENQDRIRQVFIDSAQRRLPMIQCLYLGGLYLQRTSQLCVPVDTGNLKASAFTKIEQE